MGNVLIVGKPSRERDGLALVMELAGNHCALASSVKEAGTLVKQAVYDLVLSDASLDESSPQEMVRSLRSVAPGVNVMVLAEEADSRSRADEVVTLPYSPVNPLFP